MRVEDGSCGNCREEMLRVSALPARRLIVIVVTVLFAIAAVAAKQFVMPKVNDATSYPAHDNHANEHVAIAADPYTDSKASIFNEKYEEHGLLPIFVVVSNANGKPIQLSRMRVQLVTVDRDAKIEPATNDDIYRRLSKVSRRGDEPSRNPFPIPLPRKGPKVGVNKNVREEVEAAQFRARAVDAHSSEGGFFFFDVSGIRNPLQGGTLYVTGVRDGSGQDLMYFEVPFDKAVR